MIDTDWMCCQERFLTGALFILPCCISLMGESGNPVSEPSTTAANPDSPQKTQHSCSVVTARYSQWHWQYFHSTTPAINRQHIHTHCGGQWSSSTRPHAHCIRADCSTLAVVAAPRRWFMVNTAEPAHGHSSCLTINQVFKRESYGQVNKTQQSGNRRGNASRLGANR